MEPHTPARRRSFLDATTQQYLADFQRTLAPDVLTPVAGMIIGEQSKYVSWRVPDGPRSIELLQITDVQFGHVMCKYERVLEYRDWVLDSPNRYMLWTGDNVDAWAMWSPGTAFDQLSDPQGQILKFCSVWAPARHRILGYVGGNHERRAIPGFGDLGVLIATLLKIPYSNGRQMIDIYFGQHQPFKISLWHGTGAARTDGSVAQTLSRFMAMGDSQLFLMGHLHRGLILPKWTEERDVRGRQIRLRKSIGAVGTSFLEAFGTYGEVAGYGAGDVMMARAVLEANGKWELTLR